MSVDDFAGGDQRYLRSVQYADVSKLDARSNLHARFRTAAEPWRQWLARRVPWPVVGDVLDVGCGGGDLWVETAGIVPPGLRLHLADLSPGMVAEAAARVAAQAEVVGLGGVVSDAQALPFADASFDVVVANHMLYHVPDIDRAVAEVARVLRPHGAAVVATNGGRHMAQLHALQQQVFDAADDDLTVSRFGRENGAAILGARFSSVTWEAYDDVLDCTDGAAVLAYACSHPPGESASPSERASLAAVIDAALADGGGHLRIEKDTGVFLARP